MNGVNGNRGFAMPMALLVLLITTGAVLATLNRASIERRLSDSESAGLEALLLAETGLERFVTAYGTSDPEWTDFDYPPATAASSRVDSARVDLPGGYAEVTMRQLRPAVGTASATFVLRSRGVRTEGGWGGAPEGVRVVTRIVRWIAGTADMPAAWTALGGLRKNGSAGVLNGEDRCAVQDPVGGVGVPDDPGYTGSTSNVSSIDSLGETSQEAGDGLNIDWEGIVDGTALPFDHILSNSDNIPVIGPTEWPIIYVDNPGEVYSLGQSGQGTLIVRGDMTISGTATWEGILLVGGFLYSNGNNQVYGGTVTGLNVKLGESVLESDVGNGNKTFQYDSCAVQNAMQGYTRMHVMDNTWLDNTALY